MNKEFAQLAQDAVALFWKHRPVDATYFGEHLHDDRFAIFNVEYLKDYVTACKDLNMALRRIPDEELSAVEGAHRKLLRGTLEVEAARVETLELHSRAADLYIQEILSGLHVLVACDALTFEQRGVAVLGRLRGVWRVLREGMANLRAGRNVPKIWTENAIFVTEATLRFYDSTLADFIAGVKEDTLRDDLLDAVSTSRSAIEHYLSFLRLDMLASSKGRFAVGKEHFSLLLRQRYHYKIQLSELARLGERLVEESRAALEKHASTISSDRNWMQLVEETRQKPPEQDALLVRYQAALAEAHKLAEKSGLVALPPAEGVRVSWTPGHARHFYPYTALRGPGPDEAYHGGTLWISAVETNRHDDIRQQQRAGHYVPRMPILGAVQAFPGHFTASVHRQLISDRLLRFHDAGFFRNGWTAYVLDQLAAAGCFDDPLVKLFYLRERLINAARLLLDVRMHTQEMTLEEGGDFLAEVCGFEPANAEREARRYASFPGEQIAYHLGAEEITTLRAAVEAKRGAKFDAKTFHGELLACGLVPVDFAEVLFAEGAVKVAKVEQAVAVSADAAKAASTPAPEAKKTAEPKATSEPSKSHAGSSAKKPTVASSKPAAKAAPAKSLAAKPKAVAPKPKAAAKAPSKTAKAPAKPKSPAKPAAKASTNGSRKPGSAKSSAAAASKKPSRPQRPSAKAPAGKKPAVKKVAPKAIAKKAVVAKATPAKKGVAPKKPVAKAAPKKAAAKADPKKVAPKKAAPAKPASKKAAPKKVAARK